MAEDGAVETQALIRLAMERAAAGDRLSGAFVRSLAEVLQRAERELRRAVDQATRRSALKLRLAIRAILRDAGYDAVAGASANQAVGVIAATMPVVPKETQLRALEALLRTDLLAQGDVMATEIWRALVQQTIAPIDINDLFRQLEKRLDASRASVVRLYDTMHSMLGRQMEAMTQGDDPEKPYLYAGPIDEKTRPFCLERVGRVYRRKTIDDMDNGMLPNVFITSGGWQCRHAWLAVESKTLTALADTGEWAPAGYEDRVKAVVARRAAKRALR